MERSAVSATAFDAHAGEQAEPETVVVHVQLRPRRGATRKCLAALAALAAEYGLEADPTSIPRLAQAHGLSVG